MKKYRVSVLLVILLFINLVSFAQPRGYKDIKDATAFKNNFNTKAAKTNTNEADFTQEKYISVMTERTISKGKFYFKKTNLMRWETTEPLSHIIVLNNGKMFLKEKGKLKTYDSNSNRMFKGLNDLMLTTASGNMLNSKEYTNKVYESEKNYLIELIPINSATKKFINRIEVVVDKSDYTVSEIKMIEPSEDYTRIEFSNKKLNLPINDALFTLK